MKNFSKTDLDQALGQLAMLRYWTPDLRGPVMVFLSQICPHRDALLWLIAELVNKIGYWPGSAEVRGLLCTRYDAADRIDVPCNLPGYSMAECYERHLAEHETQKTQARIGGSMGLEELEKKLLQ